MSSYFKVINNGELLPLPVIPASQARNYKSWTSHQVLFPLRTCKEVCPAFCITFKPFNPSLIVFPAFLSNCYESRVCFSRDLTLSLLRVQYRPYPSKKTFVLFSLTFPNREFHIKFRELPHNLFPIFHSATTPGDEIVRHFTYIDNAAPIAVAYSASTGNSKSILYVWEILFRIL